MLKSQTLDLLFANLFQSFSLALFFSFAFLVYWQFCCPLYRPCFAWNCGSLTFYERGRLIFKEYVVCKQRNWQWIFPQNVTFFSEYNFDRIFQNIQNEVSLERSILEVVVACLSIYTLRAEALRSS